MVLEANVNDSAQAAQLRWLRLAPKPLPPSPARKWDVFLSYRSVNRAWALALYDALREAGFNVFLDQFVLPAGVEIEGFLRDNLRASGSGVVVWSGDAAQSEFVRGELAVMRQLAKSRPGFHYVLATLDRAELPFLEQGDLYVDFTTYPEGPRGGELLKLMFGLMGQPLSDQAAREIHQINEETTLLVRRITAARESGSRGILEQIAADQPEALNTTSLPYSVLVEALIGIGSPELGLELARRARQTFSRAVRLQQLEALALRRLGRSEEAQQILTDLYQQGHRDPETLGILGATWAQRYKKEKRRAQLERSQLHYAEAFQLAPDSFYNGVNAAAKAALLGNLDDARALAARVLPLVSAHVDGENYWATATHAEAQLLLGDIDAAVRLYRKARVRHSEDEGSIASTRAQATDLVAALGADAAVSARVLGAFEP
jgi:tetratricopeptide (TPR) repeat protein